MLTILILITFLGFVISKYFKMGPFNPFTLFFGIWGGVFVLFAIFQNLYFPMPNDYFLIQICIQLIAMMIMLVAQVQRGNTTNRPALTAAESNYHLNKTFLNLFQIVLVLAIPLVYQMASSLAGDSIFTSSGFMNLRRAFNEDGANMGVFRYLFPLSFLCCGITIYFISKKELSKWRLIPALGGALFYAYTATGRTFFLMLFAFSVIPLAMTGKVKGKSFLALCALLLGAFFLVASLTAKGTSDQASLSENIGSFLETGQSYIVAPFVAVYMLFEKLTTFAYGEYTFRFFLSILAAIGFIEPPAPLIKGYEFTPIVTNIYTVYEIYIRDFSIFGFLIPPFFLIWHWFLYNRGTKNNDLFVILYAISCYALFMQPLQDQYLTLLSTWIQAVFWCLLLIRKNNPRKKLRHD